MVQLLRSGECNFFIFETEIDNRYYQFHTRFWDSISQASFSFVSLVLVFLSLFHNNVVIAFLATNFAIFGVDLCKLQRQDRLSKLYDSNEKVKISYPYSRTTLTETSSEKIRAFKLFQEPRQNATPNPRPTGKRKIPSHVDR